MREINRNNKIWQDIMFNELADEFVEVLEGKRLPCDVGLFIDSLRSPGHDRFAILDLGCGIGRLFPHFSKTGTIVVGLDYAPKLVMRAGITARPFRNVIVVCYEMSKLRDLFPQSSFDLVVRAYTSLGYFKVGVEAEILDQCRELVRPGGKLVIDTFNASYFEAKRPNPRITTLLSFSLVEDYNWDPELGVIRCVWRYNYKDGRDPKEINFILDGYDLDRIDKLLQLTGWRREGLFRDLSTNAVADSVTSERLVVVAERTE